jgi:RND family efflux transporter MFP subunit
MGFQTDFMQKRLAFTLAIWAAGFLSVPAAGPLTVDGITEPFMDVQLGFADAGIIRHQFFKEGDAVKKGDVILELDKNLEALEVRRRKAVMEQNKMIFDSTSKLSETTTSVSKEELAKAQADYDVSTADYAIAVQQLANRQLVAPFSGSIVDILLKPGAAVAPYQPLVRVVDTSRCYFIGHVDGRQVSELQLDEPVEIQADGNQTVSAKICFISPVVDAASGLARVKAVFDNSDGKVRPGIAATMTAQ